jgi:hypothetical protein
MQNRLSPKHSFPDRYKQSDFQDLIDKWIEQTKFQVKAGNIRLGIGFSSHEFQRFNKKFKLSIFRALGQVYIDIKEIK